MPDINVPELGYSISLPDGLTQEQMEQAILSHPDVMQYKQNLGNQPTQPTQAEPTAPSTPTVPDNSNKYLFDKHSFGMKLGKEFLRDIPVVGGYMNAHNPDDEEQKQFQNDHEILTGGANILGNLAATAPLSGAASALAATKFLPKFAESAPGILKAIEGSFTSPTGVGRHVLAQSGLGALLNTGDYAAGHGVSDGEGLANAAINGAESYALGPIAGKAISPMRIVKEPVNPNLLKNMYTELSPVDKQAIAGKLLRSGKTGWALKAEKARLEKEAIHIAEQSNLLPDFLNHTRPQRVMENKIKALKDFEFTDKQRSYFNAGAGLLGGLLSGKEAAVVGLVGGGYGADAALALGKKWAINQAMSDPKKAAILQALIGQTGTGFLNSQFPSESDQKTPQE